MRERGQSSTIGYVLSIAVATLLIVSLVAGVGTFVEGRQERAIRDQLTVIGERMATQLTAADTLAAREGTVYVEPGIPDRAVGMNYRVRLDASGEQLVLSTTNPAVTVRVSVVTISPLTDSTARGTDIAIRYNDSDSDDEKELSIGETR